MKKKIAVVLFNLGGPDKLASVKPFLFNLFYDPAIIRAPRPLRYLLAKFISTKKKIIVGGKNDIENGDISVDGYTVAIGICIEDDDGSVSNCIDSGNFDKIINRYRAIDRSKAGV